MEIRAAMVFSSAVMTQMREYLKSHYKFRADKTFYMGITTLVRGENVLAMLITPTNENEGHSNDVA